MNIDLLKRLCETPGGSGREHRIRKLIADEIAPFCDSVSTDAMGSLHCVRKARGAEAEAKRIMLACHMDEIGFLVSHVSKDGFISIDPIGDFDRRTLFARRVLVVTETGDLKGVLNPGGRPIHILPPEEAKKIPEFPDFFVDVGLGEKAAERVKIGDYVVMDEPLIEMGDKIVSKALDNRVACWLGIEAFRNLHETGTDNPYDIHLVFTSQEEVGMRGAGTAAFAIAPDIGIAIDTSIAIDTPGVPEHEAVTVQGKGFGLHLKDGSFIADIDLVREIEALAASKGIPSQRTMLGGSGQDGATIQRAGPGVRTATIVAGGVRYIHTVTEMIDRRDLEAARAIIIAMLATPLLKDQMTNG